MTVIISNILNSCMSIFTVVFKFIIYPVEFLFRVVKLFLDDSKSTSTKVLLTTLYTLILGGWLIIVIMITNMQHMSVINVMNGAATLMQDTEEWNKYSSIDPSKTNAPGSGSGSIDINGTNVNIDLSNLPSSVTLPSGTYQTGTVLQRAEMLLIVQEICARPEITLSAEQLLGLFYCEATAYIGASGSLVKTTWAESYNQYGCGGPFQHTKSQWDGGIGRTFISKVEDPSLSDSERVKNISQSGGLKTADGVSRPSMFFFSDAAYTAAYRLSLTYPDSAGQSATNWTKLVGEFADKNSLSSYEKDVLQFNSGLAYYNGYTSTAKSWGPAFYGDLMKSQGKISKWSSLAVSRGNLNSKLKGELIFNIPRTLPNMSSGFDYYDTYSSSLANGNWESFQYPFISHNGGKWVYDSLLSLAKLVGSVEEIVSGDGIDLSDDNFRKIYTEAKKHIGTPYLLTENLSGMNPPNNFCCASYVSWVFTKSGYKGVTSWSAQTLYNQSVVKITRDEAKPGDLIFFERTYNGPNKITHVGIWLGNNRMIHSGDPVEEKDISSDWWQSRICGFGRVKSK